MAFVGSHPLTPQGAPVRISILVHFSTILSTGWPGLSHRALSQGTQGCSPPLCHTSAWTLPGLLLLSSYQGQAMASVPSHAQLLSETKTRKPRHESFTPWRERASPGQRGTDNPTSLPHGEPQACPGRITSAFFPETTSFEHPSHGCAAPKGAKHICPLRPGHISVQAEGRGCSDGQSPSAGCPPNAGRDLNVSHTYPITGEPLVEVWRGLCHTASPGPAHRARNSTAARPRPLPPPSSPARPGQAHGRRCY